jgi:hypothetical protein
MCILNQSEKIDQNNLIIKSKFIKQKYKFKLNNVFGIWRDSSDVIGDVDFSQMGNVIVSTDYLQESYTYPFTFGIDLGMRNRPESQVGEYVQLRWKNDFDQIHRLIGSSNIVEASAADIAQFIGRFGRFKSIPGEVFSFYDNTIRRFKPHVKIDRLLPNHPNYRFLETEVNVTSITKEMAINAIDSGLNDYLTLLETKGHNNAFAKEIVRKYKWFINLSNPRGISSIDVDNFGHILVKINRNLFKHNIEIKKEISEQMEQFNQNLFNIWLNPLIPSSSVEIPILPSEPLLTTMTSVENQLVIAPSDLLLNAFSQYGRNKFTSKIAPNYQVPGAINFGQLEQRINDIHCQNRPYMTGTFLFDPESYMQDENMDHSIKFIQFDDKYFIYNRETNYKDHNGKSKSRYYNKFFVKENNQIWMLQNGGAMYERKYYGQRLETRGRLFESDNNVTLIYQKMKAASTPLDLYFISKLNGQDICYNCTLPIKMCDCGILSEPTISFNKNSHIQSCIRNLNNNINNLDSSVSAKNKPLIGKLDRPELCYRFENHTKRYNKEGLIIAKAIKMLINDKIKLLSKIKSLERKIKNTITYNVVKEVPIFGTLTIKETYTVTKTINGCDEMCGECEICCRDIVDDCKNSKFDTIDISDDDKKRVGHEMLLASENNKLKYPESEEQIFRYNWYLHNSLQCHLSEAECYDPTAIDLCNKYNLPLFKCNQSILFNKSLTSKQADYALNYIPETSALKLNNISNHV